MKSVVLLELAKSKYINGDPGHDYAHILRVKRICEEIGKSEKANLETLIPAAILHDIVNLPKDSPDRINASQMSANESKFILEQADFKEPEITIIRDIITEHSYSLGKKPSSLESAVLQDADKLDAIGAIGIMRAVTCGCRLGASYYDLSEPFPKSRDLDDKVFTIDHFYTKLFKLADKMNTNAGKIEAKRRLAFMNAFLDQLVSEI